MYLALLDLNFVEHTNYANSLLFFEQTQLLKKFGCLKILPVAGSAAIYDQVISLLTLISPVPHTLFA